MSLKFIRILRLYSLPIGPENFTAIKNCPRVNTGDRFSDITDGQVYQGLVSDGFLLNPSNISFQFNTDGVPVFQSSSFSFWPLHLIINELPLRKRFV